MESFQKEETTGLVFIKATSPIHCKLIFYRYNYLIKVCNYISSTTGINRIGNKHRWILALIQCKTKAVSTLKLCLPITSLASATRLCVQFHLDPVYREWLNNYPCETENLSTTLFCCWNTVIIEPEVWFRSTAPNGCWLFFLWVNLQTPPRVSFSRLLDFVLLLLPANCKSKNRTTVARFTGSTCGSCLHGLEDFTKMDLKWNI